MLNNDQCIEVAEKVWGWEKQLFNGVPMWITNSTKAYWATKESLPSVVNSWQGFGRTVEAMAERGFDLTEFMDGADMNPAIGFRKLQPEATHHLFVRIDWELGDLDIFRKATHLAALEAVREEEG